MHRPIRDRLEDLLQRKGGYRELSGHLESCAECSSELDAMKQQSAQLALLRADEEDLEPAAGFYARVRQRIEEQETGSLWSFLIESPFGKRLAIGSLSVAVAMSAYVVTQESREHRVAESGFVAVDGRTHYHPPVVGSPAEQRDAVLENFVSHNLNGNQGQVR